MNARTGMSAWAHGVLEAAVLVAVVGVPVFVNYHAHNVFEQSKAALLVAMGLLAALAWLIALVERRLVAPRRVAGATAGPASHGARPAGLRALPASIAGRPLAAAAWATWLATLLACVTSMAPTISVLGSYDRATGLVAISAALLLFAAVGGTARRQAGRDRLVAAILAGSVPVTVLALLQAAGVELVVGQVESVGRVFGTLSNPIFLGAYLMMVLPLTLALAASSWRSGGTWQPAAAMALGLLQLTALLASASRGPVLGLAAGLVVMALAWAAVQGRRRMAAAVALLLLAGAAGLLVINLPAGSAALREAPVIGRFAQIGETGLGSQAARLRIWDSSTRLVGHDAARLVTGYGPETLRYALLPVAEANLGGRAQADRLVDRAHNELLDALTMTGLLGAAALLLTFGAWLLTATRALGLASHPSDGRRMVGLMFLGAVLGSSGALLAGSPAYAAALALLGFLTGAGVFLLLSALRAEPLQDEDGETEADDGGTFDNETATGSEPLLLGLLGIGAALVVEAAFGIQTVATMTLFWALAGLLHATAGTATEDPLEAASARLAQGTAEPRPGARRAAADLPRKGEVRVTWSSHGAALGLVFGIGLGLLAYSFLALGPSSLPATVPAALLVVLVTWLAGAWLGGMARQGAAAVGLASAVAAVLYVALQATVLALLGDATTLLAVTLVWIVLIALLAGYWLRPRASASAPVSAVATVLYTIAATVAVAVGLVVALRPVQADMHFHSAMLDLQGAIAADDTGLFQAAEASFARAVAANPREPSYRSRWAEVFTMVGSSSAGDPATAARWFERAQAELAQAERLEPLLPYHVHNRGHLQLIFAQMVDGDQRAAAAANAEVALQSAFDRLPGDPQVANELALARILQGKADSALPVLEYVRDSLDPENPTTWQLLGAAYSAAGRTQEAAEAAQKALDLGGASPENMVTLGDMARQSGDLTTAVDWYRKAAEAGPVGWEVLYNLGLMYRDLGDTEAAVEVLSNAMQLAATEEDRTRIQDALSEVLLGPTSDLLAPVEQLQPTQPLTPTERSGSTAPAQTTP